ncbi:MAG: uracil-DNA glycosylase [Phycisphaerales bacterium]|nr:MAG: uracil-DNA glycosylase [Phycisphaerales bacterium]
MGRDSDLTREALRQQLEADRLLGIKSVPISPPPPRQPGARARVGRPVRSATAAEQAEQLGVLDETEVKGCTQCTLSDARTQTVFGQGSPSARLVFVGEAPGYEEDRQGLAFVGRAGQLLTRMIAAMGLTREQVFICNVLKCRPPGNRDPSAAEILACSPFLRRQLAIIEPEVLVALGAPAAKTLLNTSESIGKLRGRFHDYYLSGTTGEGPAIPLMPTYHPAYLLRNPAEKRKAWEDLQMVMRLLGLPIPGEMSG